MHSDDVMWNVCYELGDGGASGLRAVIWNSVWSDPQWLLIFCGFSTVEDSRLRGSNM